MNGFDREVRFQIVEHIGVISTHSTGWNKELNIVAWNGGQPKYDIRDWDSAHEHMSRGITLTEKEMRTIGDLLARRKTMNRQAMSQENDAKGSAAKESRNQER